MFGVSEEEVETQLCELILNKTVHGKIDRPTGMINMVQRLSEDEMLDNWVGDVNNVLDLIDTTANLIQRENGMGVVG